MEEATPVQPDPLFQFQRVSLERLRLAAHVILAEGEDIPDALTAELTIYKDRLERALL